LGFSDTSVPQQAKKYANCKGKDIITLMLLTCIIYLYPIFACCFYNFSLMQKVLFRQYPCKQNPSGWSRFARIEVKEQIFVTLTWTAPSLLHTLRTCMTNRAIINRKKYLLIAKRMQA